MSAAGAGVACRGCGARLAPDDPYPFRCPNAGRGDDVDHVLVLDVPPEAHDAPPDDDPQPFVRWRRRTFMHAWATRQGLLDGEYVALVHALDRAVAAIDGHGFRPTRYAPDAGLARELGIASGGVWIKDETDGVGGSHKARHLFGIALHLSVVERVRPGAARRAPLAIASCGNAALAAAIVARADGRELRVFVPTWADPRVLARLVELGATVETCARASGEPGDGRGGDPCTHRFRAAVADGAFPFTVQGPENALTLEGGATLGWELLEQHARLGAPPLTRTLVQVGGGALASSLALAAERAGRPRALGRLHAVQSAGVHPFERAWRAFAAGALGRAERDNLELGRGELGGPDRAVAAALASADRTRALERAARARSEHMRPWESVPHGLATGILDDETYDWWHVLRATVASGGWPLVVDDALLERAWQAARARGAHPVSPTGAAGLAGLLALSDAGELDANEQALVLFTGVR